MYMYVLSNLLKLGKRTVISLCTVLGNYVNMLVICCKLLTLKHVQACTKTRAFVEYIPAHAVSFLRAHVQNLDERGFHDGDECTYKLGQYISVYIRRILRFQ